MTSTTPIIIDLGSYQMKIGFRSSNITFAPTSFCSYIGEPKYNKILRSINIHNPNKKEQFIGNNCTPYLGILKLRYPIQHGAFKNERDISLIFNHIFTELGLESEEIPNHPLLITEPILNPRNNREIISEILFEKYGVSSLVFGNQPPLSLFSFSSTTGLVLESGEGVSQVCSICDGYALPCSFMRSNFGGGDVSYYLNQLLKMQGIEFLSDTEKLTLHEIKKKLKLELVESKSNEDKSIIYSLPDKREIILEHKEFDAAKVVLNPSLVGKNCLGLHQMVTTSIERVNADLREKLYSNIRLTGGNSSIDNFRDVMNTKIEHFLGKFSGINIRTASNCTVSNWNGGNILSNLGIFNDLLITKKDWEEKGKDIVHKKTF